MRFTLKEVTDKTDMVPAQAPASIAGTGDSFNVISPQYRMEEECGCECEHCRAAHMHSDAEEIEITPSVLAGILKRANVVVVEKKSFVVVNKGEVEKGEREEAGEHNFPPEQARNVALQHLTKKDPRYYTKADAAGLEEWNDSIFTKDKTGGRMGRLNRNIAKQKKKHPGSGFTVVGGSGIAGGQH